MEFTLVPAGVRAYVDAIAAELSPETEITSGAIKNLPPNR